MNRIEELMKLIKEYGEASYCAGQGDPMDFQTEEILEEIEQLLQMYIPQRPEETQPS
jgi:hypothetical protein